METKSFGRRTFINYGLISTFFFLSGCATATYKKKLVLRGVPNTFPDELIKAIAAPWQFVPIRNVVSNEFSYKSILHEKTDLLILDDGWISDLPFSALKAIKSKKIRDKLSSQSKSFLLGLGEDYKSRILPLTFSPWVILLRNEDSLTLKNKHSWEVMFSNALKEQIVFPNSPYLLSSIVKKMGIFNDLAKLKRQAKAFDDRNALNWVVSGKARAAVLPLSRCVESLNRDPRLSVLFPVEGSPLNWTVFASPRTSSEDFPVNFFEMLWDENSSKRIVSKGFLPPTDFSNSNRLNINRFQRFKSFVFPDESFWNSCWSLPILDFEKKENIALAWNKS
tara:strand:- start:433 stop:1440 length:1008 start_codon:yes stop_codon:yes gene_type:complete